MTELVQRTTKIEAIRSQLKAKNDIHYTGEVVCGHATEWLTQTVAIVVSPVNPIFSAEGLNEFMDRLTIGIKPTTVDHFRHSSPDADFELGKLTFDEEIGQIEQRTETIIYSDEPDVLIAQGFAVGTQNTERKGAFVRRTWVRPYPCEELARLVLEYEHGELNGTTQPDLNFSHLAYWIKPSELDLIKKNTGKQGYIKRLLGRFGR